MHEKKIYGILYLEILMFSGLAGAGFAVSELSDLGNCEEQLPSADCRSTVGQLSADS